MVLKNNGITSAEDWKKQFPPMGGDKQWKDGRSAKELAKYMTATFPDVPADIEKILLNFTNTDAEFEWAGEYVTRFDTADLGKGEGRNHDAMMVNGDIFVGIEGKADEPLGSEYIGEAFEKAGDNKKLRISGLVDMLWGNSPENHADIRYQLVTASAAVLLEASKRKLDKAMLLVVVFKKDGCYSDDKIKANNKDINTFLEEMSAVNQGGYYKLPTKYGKEHGIELYFNKIELDV